jgi:hypothetical protein
MQADVSGTPSIIEPDIEKMGAQTELNHDADRINSIAIRLIVESASAMKEALRIVVTSAT